MSEWIDVNERLPENTKPVLGLYGNIPCVIQYTKGHEIEFEDYSDEDHPYDEFEEKHGSLFLKAGWYEQSEQRQSDYEYIYIPRVITYWMPLPVPPTK